MWVNISYDFTNRRNTALAQLTCCGVTDHSCIFTMSTVMNSNTIMGAVRQACLSPSASYIVIVDWATALTEGSKSMCRCGSTVTKLLAHHIGISNVPAVITHSAPFPIVEYFYTPLICSGTSNQSDCTIILCCMRVTTAVRMYKLLPTRQIKATSTHLA